MYHGSRASEHRALALGLACCTLTPAWASAAGYHNLGAFWKAPPPLTIVYLGAGWRHHCVIYSNNKAKCWGDNSSAQLGIAEPSNRGDNPNEMGSFLPYVSLGTNRSVQAISVEDHNCAIMED